MELVSARCRITAIGIDVDSISVVIDVTHVDTAVVDEELHEYKVDLMVKGRDQSFEWR